MKLIDDDDKEISEINMTPFVDIILVVLIIFMTTATFMVEGKIPLNLPNANTGEPKEIKGEKTVNITITKDGKFYINDNPVKLAQLKEEIKSLKKDTVVVIRSDKDTKFQDFITIIDVCRQVGIENYSIETSKER